MIRVGATSGAKTSQAEWFTNDIIDTEQTRLLLIHFAIQEEVAIAYTTDGGTTWVDFEDGLMKPNKGHRLEIPVCMNDAFNIRKTTAGNVTVTFCEIFV